MPPAARRHRDVDILAAVGTLDADAAVPDMLRTEPDDLAAPRCGLQRELHHETLLRAERPIRAILRDLVIGPGVMAVALGQLDALDAVGWIVLDHARDRGLQQRAGRLQPMPFR